MADNSAVASLLAALTQRAQQQQQQQQPSQPSAPQQAYPNLPQFDPRHSPSLSQYAAPVQTANLANSPLLAQLAAAGLPLQNQANLSANPNAAAALASLAAAAATNNNTVHVPAPSNTGYLDINQLNKADPRESLSIGEYYGKVLSRDGRSGSYDEPDYRGDTRNRYRDRDYERDRDRDHNPRGRERRRSPTPPRLRANERCREFSPERDPSPGGSTSITLVVKTPFVGLIIGRGGETLKRIEQETGARIQFITNGKEGPDRVCNISGRVFEINAAKRIVIDMIESALLDGRGRPLQNGTGSRYQ
ncbi:uncharacterized protein V2V93DRAFT_367657 [Kockiozyma suomiensis]|uniref:uncharacterized protein n=1 Tax=Kockiozyma suomiensis TaxID=1337062 RepID=UPI00334334A6